MIFLALIILYLVIIIIYFTKARKNEAMNFYIILSVLCMIISLISIYNSAIYADEQGIGGRIELSSISLIIVSILLLGKSYFNLVKKTK